MTIAGTAFEQNVQIVTVYNGRRGPVGPEGDKGDTGDTGPGFSMLGNWISGSTYCPRDAVTSRSSMVYGIQSLWIQNDNIPCGVSTLEPHLDPSRWSEIGYDNWGDTFGGTWEVLQFAHGFTMVGQPVAYSGVAGAYVMADSRNQDTLGIAIVREIVDADHFVLQSTGLVPAIDDRVIYPPGSSWSAGAVYYVSDVPGSLKLEPPVDNSYFVNPILKVGQVISGTQSGIALPWAPLAARPLTFLPVGTNKFYFNGPATTISGLDIYGNLLEYDPGPNTDVFVNGLNLLPTAYTATDGLTITFTPPLAGGAVAEIWTPNQPTAIIVPATTLKLDNIEDDFDGVQTVFPLTYGALPVVLQDVTSVMIYLDVNPQEPDVDYQITPNVSVPTNADITFANPPEAGTRFWGLALSPAGASGLPPGGAAGTVLGKLSATTGDVGWFTEIFGGTF